ncbi:MAG: nucleotide exchange factor GrpE [Planctomycetaceae bacterium]|nr:nucleotide exchange factor GrpE [Planctomycetaceae bacterium]
MNEERNTDDASEVQDDVVAGVDDASDDVTVEDPMQQLADERDAARDQALRAQAELENYRKRTNRERDEERRYAALPIIRDLLPSLDNLQRAIDAASHTDDLSAMLQGVEMVSAQMLEILARHGATPISSVGEAFDPNKHEAIQQMPSADHPPMTVIDEVERGYTLNDRVVRPSKVIVSVAPPSE